VFTFLNVAAIFFLTQAYFLAVVQILVYAGAIMVLFFFVIMLLNLRTFEQEEQTHRRQRWLALALSVLVLAEFVIVLAGITFTSVRGGFTPEAIAEAGAAPRCSARLSSTTCCCLRGGVGGPAGRHGGRHRPGQTGEDRRGSHTLLGTWRAALPRGDRGGGVAAVGAPPTCPYRSDWYLYLSAALFIVGAAGVLIRRNLFIMLFSLELMLNASTSTWSGSRASTRTWRARISCSS